MTNVKKVVAVLLAFLMIFSSASVLASAWDATVDDGFALDIETKFFKQVGGEWVETTKVRPRDTVQARVYLGTDYYSNDSTLLFFYDKDFFTHTYTATPVRYAADDENTVVNANNSFVTDYDVTARVAADPNLSTQISNGYIDSDFTSKYGAINAIIEVNAENESNVMYDNSDYILAFTLTVAENAKGEGDFFVKDTTVQSSARKRAIVNVPKGSADGTDVDLWAMRLWDADVTLASKPVSTISSVTFNANGGTFADGTDSVLVEGAIDAKLADIKEVPAVTYDGYAFMGWIDAADTTPTLEEVISAPELIPENELVLNAFWMETVDITFNTAGGSAIPAIEGAKPYDAFAEIANPTKDGYTFVGWDVRGNMELPETYPAVDTTYTAIWAKNVVVSFNTNGADAIESIPGIEGEAFNYEIEDPSKDGYYFIGWTPALPTVFPAEDTTYTANFEAGAYTVSYYVDGVLVGVLSKEFGEEISTSVPGYTVPTGYSFDGWYTDAACENAFVSATYGSDVTELYAKTTANTYDAVFNANGGAFADGTDTYTVSVLFDEDIVPPADPERAGYDFLGWDSPVGTMEAEGMTFNALWVEKVDAYKVTYYVQNEEFESFYVTLNADLEVPASPDIAGWKFIGWEDAETGIIYNDEDEDDSNDFAGFKMPAKAVNFNAVLERSSATITFYDYEALDATPWKGDATSTTAEVNYGEDIVFPANNIVKAEYWIFLGWAETEGGEVIDTTAIEMAEGVATEYYAVYKKVDVKLVPKAGSTTMIERDGEIESYNDGYTVSTEFVETTDETKNLIYGLKLGLKDTVVKEDLLEDIESDWITVQGDGYTEVYAVSRGRLGTGTLVEVKDRNGTEDKEDDFVVESFYVVIFGDLDGNSRLSAVDTGLLDDEIFSPEWSATKTRVEYMFRAANLDGNRRISAVDSALLTDAIFGAVIDQVEGMLVEE